MTLAASPIRFPDVASRTVMTRRAWWLVVLNFLIPGSAQVLAGDRKLGRFGLGATLTLWFLVLAALVAWFLWPTVLYTVFSTTITLWIVAAVLAFYAVLWVVLSLDTLRLVRLVKTAPSARAWVAMLSVAVMVAISGTAAYGAY
ncbi:MAG TPA: LytR family transcriptional regulator, partial [Agromyces sp.]|nr:LytR family transcriptional regulator [Agromyces sp.]